MGHDFLFIPTIHFFLPFFGEVKNWSVSNLWRFVCVCRRPSSAFKISQLHKYWTDSAYPHNMQCALENFIKNHVCINMKNISHRSIHLSRHVRDICLWIQLKWIFSLVGTEIRMGWKKKGCASCSWCFFQTLSLLRMGENGIRQLSAWGGPGMQL